MAQMVHINLDSTVRQTIHEKEEDLGFKLNLRKNGCQYNLAMDCTVIKRVENFKYLGVWNHNSCKEFEVRKALVWSACDKLLNVWKSDLNCKIEKPLFLTTGESVLL